MLRCFNDCFAVFFLWLAIFAFQRRAWTAGALAFSWGLGIKMSLLLVLPAVAILLFLGRGLSGALRVLWIVVQVQLGLAVPFLSINAKGYFGRAFELSRQFKFEWTVNWRMVGEDVFLSRWFSLTLLAGHVSVLLVFIIVKWLAPADRPLLTMIKSVVRLKSPFTPLEELRVASQLTPEFIMSTVLSANVLGLLFARSLHYQFYAYLAWATPYLIWRFAPNPIAVYAVWYVQEWAWNIFPSTDASSSAVVGVLAVTVVAAYFGFPTLDSAAQLRAQEAAAKNK